MSARIFALLVGINDYSSDVGKLHGCLNDVDHFHEYLKGNFDKNSLRIEVLKNSDATRPNIISQFRQHLCQATKDDIVVFQYSGHGARWKAAREFSEFVPEGMDEGLVCHDSRAAGGFDLADKELAVLLSEVAKNNPHIAVFLDCCHSGSATRNADNFTQLKARQTHERADERPLDSYLGGHYAALRKRGESLQIPASRHILLAACERKQKAWESKDLTGVFTTTLLEVLSKARSDITYADLFVRCRSEVRKRAERQEPQFETYGSFNAYGGFLGGKAAGVRGRYSVFFQDNDWNVDCGAIHGLPTDAEKPVEFALFAEANRAEMAGRAVATQVGAQKSVLKLVDLDADKGNRYEAEVTRLPAPPLPVFLTGDPDGTKQIQEHLIAAADRSIGVTFSDVEAGTRYVLVAENKSFLLKIRETGELIQGAEGYSQTAANHIFGVLKKIATWERAIKLQNNATKMKPQDVELKLYDVLKEKETELPGNEITIDLAKEQDGEDVPSVQVKIKARNLAQQTLHLMLVDFSDDFGIQPIYNEPTDRTEQFFTLTYKSGQSSIWLWLKENEGDEAIHHLKLIVSTEKVDDFLLEQPPIEKMGYILPQMRSAPGRGTEKGLDTMPPVKKGFKNEWFTHDLRIRLVRQVDQVGPKAASLANGQIRIKEHPSLSAVISLGAAETGARSISGGGDFYKALERQGFEVVNFSSTRGENMSVLELSDIKNDASLRDTPLEIELDVELKDDEYILPLTFDGDYALIAGEPSKDQSGHTQISIRQIPETPINRRSLGKALKLYFFKTYLRRDNVNQLCWVEYKPDGSVERHRSGVADKVATAQNVLLLMHGIIGDTLGMAQGLRLASDSEGKTVDQKFDLILTYDYENLSTPIGQTAAILKRQLTEVGFHKDDGKRLTLLVHSMGGLIARWFVEREGGNEVVDHLVMFGTPNSGSPFGEVTSARTLSSVLTTLAINTFPAFAPFGGALLYLLNRSTKVTPTLEQMSAGSDFIQQLNSSPDPKTKYTLIAGDVRDYREDSKEIMKRVVAQLGAGILFDTLYKDTAHDIAVSGASILSVNPSRNPPPRKENVVCHHMNYFICDAGLKKMAEVEW